MLVARVDSHIATGSVIDFKLAHILFLVVLLPTSAWMRVLGHTTCRSQGSKTGQLPSRAGTRPLENMRFWHGEES